MNIYVFAVIAWFWFMPLAIINGIIRSKFYAPKLGELKAHQLSTVIFTAIIMVITTIFLSIIPIAPSNLELFLIGVDWVVLTILFEFTFGHFIMHHSWKKLLADYDIRHGRMWSLVLLTLLLAPIIIGNIL